MDRNRCGGGPPRPPRGHDVFVIGMSGAPAVRCVAARSPVAPRPAGSQRRRDELATARSGQELGAKHGGRRGSGGGFRPV